MNSRTMDLFDILSETLEQQAFLVCDKCEVVAGSEVCASGLLVSIEATGVADCAFSMILPESLCILIAENILGDDAEVHSLNAAMTRDAIGELANVIAGSLFYQAGNISDPLHLSSPSIESVDAAAWKTARARPDMMCMMIEDIPVQFSINIDGHACVDQELLP